MKDKVTVKKSINITYVTTFTTSLTYAIMNSGEKVISCDSNSSPIVVTCHQIKTKIVTKCGHRRTGSDAKREDGTCSFKE